MKIILIVLALAGLAWSTNYYVSTTGTATSKTGSVGPVTDNTKCMPSKVHKSQTYSAGDTIFWSYQSGADSVFRDTGTTVFKTPTFGTSTNPVVYKAEPGKHPIINASADYSHGATWHWHASATGNYYYVTTAANANPSIATLPTNVWVNNFKYNSGTLASLQDRQSALGDLDGLGYNTVYIRRDAGNPATGTVLVEFSVASKYAWSNTTAGNGLVVDGFIFTHGTTIAFNSTVADTNVVIKNCTFEKTAGLVNWQRIQNSRMDMCTFRHGYSNSTHTFQLDAATTGKIGVFSLNYCVFQDLRYDGLYVAADSIDTIKLNNCTFYGVGSFAIQLLTTSRAIVVAKNCIFGTCQTSGSGNGFVLENLSSVGGVIYYKNSFMGKPAAVITHAVNSSNVFDSGGNIVLYSPLFKKHSKPILFAWTNDDSPTWTVLRDSLRALRDSIHLPMTTALNATDGQGSMAAYNNAVWWDSIVGWKNQGNGIALHTRSHFQCSTPNCISIIYAGGEPCSLTIDTATHQFSTVVTGNESRNITICLDSAKWYYGYGTDSLIARVNRTTGYTAAAIGSFSKSTMYDSIMGKITLASLTKKNIAIKCTLGYYEPVLFNYEIRGNFSDIVTKSGITPQTMIWSVGGGQTMTAIDTVIACGLLGARENNSEFLASNYDYQNLYTLRPWAMTSGVITTDTGTIITSVYQNLSYGGYTGKPTIFYEHASAATVPTYRTMMRALNRYKTLYYPNIKYLTLDSLVLQLRSRGSIKDTNRYLELNDPDSADLRLMSVSALVNASTDTSGISGIPNLYDMAGKQITNSAGHVLLSTLSMGAYNDPYSASGGIPLGAPLAALGTGLTIWFLLKRRKR